MPLFDEQRRPDLGTVWCSNFFYHATL